MSSATISFTVGVPPTSAGITLGNSLVTNPNLLQNAVTAAVSQPNLPGVVTNGIPITTVTPFGNIPTGITAPPSVATLVNSIEQTGNVSTLFSDIGALLSDSPIQYFIPIQSNAIIQAFGGKEFLGGDTIYLMQTSTADFSAITNLGTVVGQQFSYPLLRTLNAFTCAAVLSDTPLIIQADRGLYMLTINSANLTVNVGFFSRVGPTYQPVVNTTYSWGDPFIIETKSYRVLTQSGNICLIQPLSVILNSTSVTGDTLTLEFYNPCDTLGAFSWNRTTSNVTANDPQDPPLIVLGAFEKTYLDLSGFYPNSTDDVFTWDVYGADTSNWKKISLFSGSLPLSQPLNIPSGLPVDNAAYLTFANSKKGGMTASVAKDNINYFTNETTITLTVNSPPGSAPNMSFLITDTYDNGGKLLYQNNTITTGQPGANTFTATLPGVDYSDIILYLQYWVTPGGGTGLSNIEFIFQFALPLN